MSLHNPRRRRGAATLAVSALLAASAVSALTRPAAAAPAEEARAATVTLITGDKVTVGPGALRVERPDGTATGYTRRVEGEATYVYPDEALPLIAQGRLDRRLFNVTGLIADGYDDAHTSALPLIVRYRAGTPAARQQLPGGAVTRTLDSLDAAAVTRNRAQAVPFWGALKGSAVDHVWLDGKVEAELAESTAQVGAPRLWGEGAEGKDVDVAVLDSGIDAEHPDLADRIEASASFVPTDEDATDFYGHGTHVASTIAGTGAASDGLERGVAPGARLHVGKVLDGDGRGQESWIIAGMEWAAREQRSRIVSMSLGGPGGDGSEPMSAAVDALSAETGTLFVIAAGNSGPADISSPGSADAALTVGAVDADDQLAEFSSTGPRHGDGGLKPEITAPGVDILAARSHYVRGSGFYQTMSGTSMATPHVAGAAALVAAAHPDWSGERIKQALVGTARPTPQYTAYQAGAGRLDAYAAAHATVFGTVSAYSGFFPYGSTPTAEDQTLTYTNDGDAPVTLKLAVQAEPAGAFSLDKTTVTVAAHGSATAALRAKPDLVPVDRPVSGFVRATDESGVERTRTLIGLSREGERHNLTVAVKDRDGKPVSGKVLFTDEHLFGALELDAEGRGTVRLPVGTYTGWTDVDVRGVSGPRSKGQALLTFTDVKLDRDRTVTLDARQARRITARVPQPTTPTAVRVDVHRGWPNAFTESSRLPDESYDSSWALPTGRKVTNGTFEFGARFRLEQPALTVHGHDNVLVQRSEPPLAKGRHTLTVGTQPRRGQALVVRDNGDIAGQAAAAARAGVKLLLVVNTGTGRLHPWPDEVLFGPDQPAPVTVVTLGADEGEALLRRPGRITITSNPTTDYLYDVVHHWTGAVPADPTFRSGPADLARVNVAFQHHRPGKALEFRADAWHGFVVGNQVPATAQGTRTDWVTAGATWYDDAFLPSEMGQHRLEPFTPRAGRTSDETWFGPILRPRQGPGHLPVRYLDGLYLPVPGWGGAGRGYAGETGGSNFAVSNRAELYRGDELLNWGNAEFLPVTGLPAGREPYRVVLDNNRAAWTGPYSTRTHTEWTFTSAASGDENAVVVPMIQLDYVVALDRAGRAARDARLTVTASQLPGVTAKVGKAEVEVSYDDGRTWQRGSTLRAPRSASFVSLRVSARDNAGNTVKQELTRAFGLR
ncbi:S8 family serine peptidase [Actinoplanes sp. TRM 88003]|uniref:S8 family serine peptidase n=1 Tax=Paractinoplanes aksuensis TaxID=2939490 RepID=A0ABT1DHQ0_9ACTN|nr:S8 family serine peptidase [Actinoplanes aksuensis]MCO8270322.1 S8 family serine peptidase [Actinoplanes aksuensis]